MARNIQVSLVSFSGAEVASLRVHPSKAEKGAKIYHKKRWFYNEDGGYVLREGQAPEKPKAKGSFLASLVLFGLVGFGVYSCMPEPKTPEQLAAEQAEKARKQELCQKSNPGVSTLKILAKSALKEVVRDPSSVEVIDAHYVGNGVFRGSYRAKNGFGGITVETYTVGFVCVAGLDSPTRSVYMGK